MLDAPVGSTAAHAVTLAPPVAIPFLTDQPADLTRVADGTIGLAAQIETPAHRDEAVTAAAIAATAWSYSTTNTTSTRPSGP